MSEHASVSQSWFARLCGRIFPCGMRPRLRRGSRVTPADELDQRLARDIGHETSTLPDRRGDHYRRLLKRGYPLG
ncbi:hypothetical protein [Hoeflea sp.]|uniref:hypothetical protein n=1 Tax=Hoeflea sp. TaxID=1940281 RepID=UPI0025BCBDEB|nr:hypothetical protein [Hoeflea sp.]